MEEANERNSLYQDRKMSETAKNFKEANKCTKLLLIVGIATTFGTSVPVGYNIGVINAPADDMKNWCNVSLINRYDIQLDAYGLETLWATIVSIFLVGGAIGSLSGAWLADFLGRKTTLLTCGIMFFVSAVCFYICQSLESVELLLIGRLIVGLASGLTTSTVPMYLTEIAPLALRGTFGVLCSMGVTCGVVIGQVLTLSVMFGTPDKWHLALSAYAILVVFCFAPYRWFPESPKYLFSVVGDRTRTENELMRLRSNNRTLVQNELDAMERSMGSQVSQRSLISVLTDPVLLLPLVLVCALQAGQQLSGINAVFYYSVRIFQSAGLTSSNAKLANLGAGIINLLTAFLSPYLMAKVNRRPLIMLSCVGSAIFLLTLTVIVNNIEIASWLPYASIIAVFGYIIVYQIGLGPIPFFIGSELFETGPRPAAMSMGSLASWTANFVVGMTFPVLQPLWGAYVFLPFAITCVFLMLLLRMYLPETRGQDATDIAPLVSNGFHSRPTLPSQ